MQYLIRNGMHASTGIKIYMVATYYYCKLKGAMMFAALFKSTVQINLLNIWIFKAPSKYHAHYRVKENKHTTN